jgi:hypothetical protein
MTSAYDRLGITPTASPEEIKAAYHAKLKEFPAHRYPEEFKAIRSAYDEVRKGGTPQEDNFFFLIRPIDAPIDPTLVQQLQERIIKELELTVDELIRETF